MENWIHCRTTGWRWWKKIKTAVNCRIVVMKYVIYEKGKKHGKCYVTFERIKKENSMK